MTMKHSLFALTLAAALLSGEAAHAFKPTPRTDRETVLQSNAPNPVREKVQLESGLYSLGQINDSKSLFMVLTDSVLDTDVKVGLMLERDFQSDCVTNGRLVIARQIRNGSVMISPLKIDRHGSLVSVSETETDAPVFLVSRREDGAKREYPYLVEPKNGAASFLLGMTHEKNSRFELIPSPSVGIFHAQDDRRRNIVYNGTNLSFYVGNTTDLEYGVVPMNGLVGGIAGLTTAHFDPMLEDVTMGSDVQKIAFFLRNSNGHEMIMIGTPSVPSGMFRFEGYSLQTRSLADFFNRGRF
jgi:hypothetical protein